MNRQNDRDAASSCGQGEFRTVRCLSAAIFCFLGIAFVNHVYATQESGRQESAQPGVSGKTSPGTGTEKTKIAEGEYAVNEEANGGAVGPAGGEVYNFHESWSLSRTANGQYEVEGVRKFESPRDVEHANRFLVQLTRDLTLIRMTEFAKLVWRRDSGPLMCEFLRKEIHCSSGARNPEQAIDLRIPMEIPYGLLWPISPFSLSGLTRQAEREVNHPTPVQLLSVEQPNADNPVSPIVRNGQLTYAGTEDIETADRKWQAYKFILKVPSYPAFSIWTSSKGLLLSVAVEHKDPSWPLESLKLVRFKEWTNFSGQAGL